MFNLPEEYIVNKIVDKSQFIPKDETTINKKKLRENILRVKILAQIDGKDIASYLTENHNVMAIMMLGIEIKDIKQAEFINNILQKQLKVFTVIKFIDKEENISLGYGYKRLNEVNKKEIVLEKTITTDGYREIFFDERYSIYINYLDFNKIINKNNKLDFYLENMGKVYLINNKENIKNYKNLLNSKLWYSRNNIMELIDIVEKIELLNKKDKKIKLTSERMENNKKLVKLYEKLEDIVNGKV